MLTLLNGVYEHLEKAGTFVRIVFVDFSSAFNTIQPHLLVKKLLDMDVNSRIILWINSFLTQGEQQVRINSTVSPRLVTNTRAPQGCVLSPLLYTIYTNDCVAMSPNKTMIKYADDTCIVGCMYPNNDSLQSFNQEISLFVEWWEQNYREINVNKTKELIVDYR